MFNQISSLAKFFRTQSRILSKDNGLVLAQLLMNLEKEDISHSDRQKVWDCRRDEEAWNFSNEYIVRANINSFLYAYQSTKLFKEFGYFVGIKDIDYANCTVTLFFKCRNESESHTYHIFDLERIIRGCNEPLGANTEVETYLKRRVY